MGKLNDFSLYVITGENYHPGRAISEVMEEALQGGADIVQLRDKTSSPQELLRKAQELKALTRRYGVPLIINDHIELAIEVEADGVHLGQEDLSLQEARRLLGSSRIIGISTHAIEEARAAELGGADYIGVGPVYPTGTKPGVKPVTLDYVRQVAAEITIPFVAIGGITPGNVDDVLEAGAKRICAVSAIVGSSDVKGTARLLSERVRSSRGSVYAPKEIVVNGRPETVTARTVDQLIARYGLQGRKLVVELDGYIVPQDEWAATQLFSGVKIELVHFVGGG
ncbi:thiamine phosphate synthase [Paenibacillus abyssi]|nr:thiamine phosphate synthase [Paenibacillus abyssi]